MESDSYNLHSSYRVPFTSEDRDEASAERFRLAAEITANRATDRYGVSLDQFKGVWRVVVTDYHSRDAAKRRGAEKRKQGDSATS